MQIKELITRIRARATELDKKSLAVQIEEGDHRCSTDDDYYRGGADTLRELAHDLEMEAAQRPDEWLDKSGNERHLIRNT